MSHLDEPLDRLSAPPLHQLDPQQLAEKVRRLQVLFKVGLALSAERNRDRLVEQILLEAKALCHADGGTLYLREGETLRFEIMRSDSLELALGGTTGNPVELPPLPLRHPVTGDQNLHNVATAAANLKRSFNIVDAYREVGFDFAGTKAFDERNNYRSRSFLTIPLVNQEGDVIGVLQLINVIDPSTGAMTHFTAEQQNIVEALASQAAVALDNQQLVEGQRRLMESFIRMLAAAIDAKSPYTGAHCERVPVLTMMLVRSLCEAQSGPYAGYELTDAEWYELQIAAWLHDCGKVTTPVHVMDKATKLETISDRIHVVRARFEVLRQQVELDILRRQVAPDADLPALALERERRLSALDDDLAFLERANIGGEFMSPEMRARVREIGARPYCERGVTGSLLSEEEVANLSVSRGTLTDAERLIINGHMVETIKMLEALPFPRHLARVPEYAGGHHERMDGRGYPRGIYAGDLSVPARAMAIADVFEALTAQDRPYKPGKTLSEAVRIMGFMKRDGHLDPTIFDHFVRAGVYREYAEQFLPAELIDEVDEAALLAIQPSPLELPSRASREARRTAFLPEYREQAESRTVRLPSVVPPRK